MKYFLSLSALFFCLSAFLVSESYAQCPTIANVTVASHTNVTCNGAGDGTITVDIADASLGEPYNFELYDLNAGAVVIGAPEVETKATRSVVYSNVAPGTYAVLLFKGGCGYPGGALTIIEPPFGFVVDEPAVLAVTPTVQPDCDPSATGTGQIDIAVTGGNLPYTIIWTGPTAIPNGTTSTAANLNAGTYNVDITDAEGCNINQDIIVAVSTQADAGPATGLTCGTNSFALSGNTPNASEIGTWSGPPGVTFTPNANTPNATANNLNVGVNTLTWTITDAGGICTGTSDDIDVTYSDVDLNGTADVLLDCFGDTDATGTFTISGGIAPFTWSTLSNTAGATYTLPPTGGTTSVAFTGGGVGVVTLQVQDAGGCTSQATITITQPTALSASVTSITNVNCNGGATGAINITVSGGTPGYTYVWSNGAVTEDVTGLIAGTYSVTITDANGCSTALNNINVTEPAVALSASTTSVTNVLCKGDATGAINITVAGGTPGYTFVWSNGAVTEDVSGLIAGTYSVTVTDANGCSTSINNISVTEPATGLTASVTSTTNVLCNGGTTGAIDITVSGGTPGYTYAWSNGAVTEDIAGIPAGTYSVTITDASGCITSLTNISITQPASALSATVTSITNVACNGGATGAINITVTGGTPGYTFVWSNGAVTEDITGLAAGTYSVTITDANGCSTALNNISVTEPASALSASVTSVTNVLCNGGATGAINITVTGGTPGYTYVWSNGAVTEDVTGLTAGTYSVTITDANGCSTALNNINVTQPASAVSASVTSVTNVLCNGGATGAINITVSGGTPGYTFAWSNGAVTEDVTGLAAGTYSVTITDANGCGTTLNNINVTQPASAVSASVTSITNVLCNGGATGAIDITVSGGTPGYTFAWSNGAVTEDITGLTAGTYSVTITDANGCGTTLNNINVTQPSALSASVTSVTNVLCNGGTTGAINISVSGGTPGYTFVWSNGAVTEDVTGLPAGTYSVTITDANGCGTTLNNINVTQPASAVSASVTSITNVLCNGGATGAIDITVSGGTPGYTFAWSNGAVTEDVTGLTAGTYSVTITDANGCGTTLNNINVTQPAAALSATVTSITNVVCNGGATGAIDITVTGGTPGYTFAWSNGAVTEDVTGLAAGTYSVTITDANGCGTTLNNINVTQPASAPSASVTSITNVLCNGGATGAIDITVTGGTPGYTFAWSNGAVTEDVTGLTAGTYSVTITDANGCGTTLNNINVTQPASALTATVTSITNVSCNGGATGAIDITVTGGTPGYTFAWSNGAVTEDVTGLTAGTYSVTITDVNGCGTTLNNISVTEPASALSASVTSVTNALCNGGATGAIDITVSGGTPGYTFVWSNGAVTEDVSGLVAGTYSVSITDAGGCSTTLNNINITEPTALTASVTSITNVVCNGDATGAIDITVSGATPGYTFAWSNGAVTEDVTGLTAGTYSVTITDANGCSTTLNNITVTQPAAIAVTSTVVDNDKCVAPFNGAILISVSPAASYTFAWTGPNGFTASTEDITALESGAYQVNITNNSTGCSTSANFTVGDNAPVVTITTNAVNDNTACSAPFNGIILVSMSPAGSYSYAWTGPNGFTAATEDISGLEQGDYTLVATNAALGCSASTTITVGDNTPVVALGSQTITDNTSCQAPFNGSITVTGSGAGPFTFSWTGPNGFTATGATINNLEPGDYDVTITDQTLGCSDTYTLTVGNATPVVTITLDATTDNTACVNLFTGALSITPGGTPGPFTISWTGPNGFTSGSEDITALEDGDYDVTVTDNNLGCSASATFTVGDNKPVVAINVISVTDNSSCQAPFNGAITVDGAGTPGPYTFAWTGPNGFSSTGATITALENGDYDVVITDSNLGCQGTFTVTVNDATPTITVTQTITDNTSCVNPFNGAIEINSTAGTPGPWSYSWTGPNAFTSNAEDITGLEPGDYTVTVTDSNLGCQDSFTFTVNDAAPVISITQTVTDNSNCAAPFNGSIDITSTTGTPGPWNYSWTGPNGFTASTEDIATLEAGTYQVTVTDVNLGCSLVADIVVGSSTPVLSITQNITPNTNCLAPFNGAIDITSVTGTAGPFDFNWTGPNGFAQAGVGLNQISNLEPGLYDVVITDTNLGCSGSFQLTVLDNSTNVSINLNSITSNSNCSAPFNGAIDVTIGGTPGPYTISWTGPGTFTASTEDIASLPQGNYTITVTDDLLGCQASATFTVGSTATGCGGLNCFAYTITVVTAQTQRPSCDDQNDGVITLDITGVTPGSYIIKLLKPADPLFSALTQVGPSGVYTFNGLSPGNYEYSVEDQAGNICQQPYSLPVESTVSADATGLVDATCFDEATGQATITVLTGGNAPYEYSLDGTSWVSFTSPHTITDLPPNGTYSILVRDDAADACPDEVTVTINNANTQITAAFSETAATCGNADGSIAVTTAPSGGAGGPYTFRIDGTDATAPFTNLSGGTHIVTVIDAIGCARNFTRVIPYPDLIEVGGISTTDAACGSLGNISLFINNFLPAVQYEVGISTSLFDEPDTYFTQYYLGNGIVVVNDLSKGNYYIWLRTGSGQCPTIANNIIANDPIVINGPYAISFEFGCRNANGDLQLRNVTGAPAVPFTFELFSNGFTNTGSFTPDVAGNAVITGFTTGSYTVRLFQDQSGVGGCADEQTDFQLAPLAALDTVFTRIPSPKDQFEKSFPEEGTASRVVRIQESGQADYEIKLELIQAFGQEDPSPVKGFYTVVNREYRFDNLYAGLYTLTLQDGYGCVKTYDMTIPLDQSIWIPNIFTPNGDGFNDTFMIRNLPLSGTELIVSNRWGKEVYASKNYQGDWGGGNATDGVYFYRLQVEGGKVYTGWVEIMRGQKP
jgi:gliding motility-associated-like protein